MKMKTAYTASRNATLPVPAQTATIGTLARESAPTPPTKLAIAQREVEISTATACRRAARAATVVSS
jgi:hypothetical protein